MATEWFYTREGKKTGPLSSSGLKALADSGKLLPTDLIWKEGMAKPRPAGEIPKLFTVEGKGGDGSTPATTPSTAPETLLDKVKAGARTAAAKAEIASITNFTLPNAYAALGKQLWQSAEMRGVYPRQSTEIEDVNGKIERLKASAGERKPTSFADKAKAIALAAKELAEVKALELQLRQAFIALGKVAYESGLPQGVPPELVEPIRAGVSKLKQLAEADSLTPTKPTRRLVTKRRVLIGAAAAGLIGLVGIGNSQRTSRTQPIDGSTVVRAVEEPSNQRSIAPAKAAPQQQASQPPQHNGGKLSDEQEKALLSATSPLSDCKVWVTPDKWSNVLRVSAGRRVSGSDLAWLQLFPTIEHLRCDKDSVDLEYALTLRQLRIIELGIVDMKTLTALADKCPGIEALSFGWKDKVAKTLPEALARFPKLKCLRISFPNLSFLGPWESSFNECRELRTVELQHATVASVGSFFKALHQHPVLRTVVLKGESRNANRSEVMPFGLLTGCPELRSLATSRIGHADEVGEIISLKQITGFWCGEVQLRDADTQVIKLRKSRPGLLKEEKEPPPSWLTDGPPPDTTAEELVWWNGHLQIASELARQRNGGDTGRGTSAGTLAGKVIAQIRKGMSATQVFGMCKQGSIESMALGLGQMWIVTFPDQSNAMVTFDKHGEVFIAKEQ